MNPRWIHRLAGVLLLLKSAIPSLGEAHYVQTLEEAHEMFRGATHATQYADAARHYEYLVNEEGIRNGHLFYTLGNSWFMADDLGRAILNYRRAQQYLPNDADVQHNLRAAREHCMDLIPTPKPRSHSVRMLRWHTNTSSRFRWRFFAGCWILFWLAWARCRQTTRREPRIGRVVTAALSIALLASLLTETIPSHRARPGVILAPEVLARKGDGERYAPAFLDPLHAGTEFNRLEDRGAWWQIQLHDKQTCWIPSRAAEMVSFSPAVTPAGRGP